MKVFLSWSGSPSKELAGALRRWLPKVIQRLRPFYTPSDIDKGARWATNLAAELGSSSFGIFCITSKNLAEPWIHFEAGALSKGIDDGRVCPILFTGSEGDIIGPLAQFQCFQFCYEEMLRLARQLNRALGDGQLDDAILLDSFELHWPQLQKETQSILDADSHSAAVGESTHSIVLEVREILRRELGSGAAFYINRRDQEADVVIRCLSALVELASSEDKSLGASGYGAIRSIYASLKYLFEGVSYPSAQDRTIQNLFARLDKEFALPHPRGIPKPSPSQAGRSASKTSANSRRRA